MLKLALADALRGEAPAEAAAVPESAANGGAATGATAAPACGAMGVAGESLSSADLNISAMAAKELPPCCVGRAAFCGVVLSEPELTLSPRRLMFKRDSAAAAAFAAS